MPFPVSRRSLSGLLLPALPAAAFAQQGNPSVAATAQAASISAELAREIARETYIWATRSFSWTSFAG